MFFKDVIGYNGQHAITSREGGQITQNAGFLSILSPGITKKLKAGKAITLRCEDVL